MINSYKIPVSNTILQAYNTIGNKGLFDADNNFFCLQHNPKDLSFPPREKRVTSPGLLTTYVTKTIQNPVIQVETRDGRETLRLVLEAIQEEANDLFFPLHDFVHPENSDIQQGFTVRNVILESITPIGGTFRSIIEDDSDPQNIQFVDRITGLGWRITFQEDVRQFYDT